MQLDLETGVEWVHWAVLCAVSRGRVRAGLGHKFGPGILVQTGPPHVRREPNIEDLQAPNAWR